MPLAIAQFRTRFPKLAILIIFLLIPQSFAAPPATRPIVLAHYMPWFEADPAAERYGWHWTMNAFDPTKLNAAGQPSIASKDHPLIGPYDSGDPAVIEYHLLLMRVAGIEGIVIDWYGTTPLNDYAAIDRNTSAIFAHLAAAKLRVALCYEDSVIPKLIKAGQVRADDRVGQLRRELDTLAAGRFKQPAYLRVEDRPVLLSFGQSGLTDAEWSAALHDAPDRPLYFSEHAKRAAADGAFDFPNPRAGIAFQAEFLRSAAKWPIAIAAAYPRFDDFYAQANVRPSYGSIPDDNGRTFSTTLQQAMASGTALVQLCTWNDWGEGTQIEPSIEYGYRDLEVVQNAQFAGQPRRPMPADLRLPTQLLKLRKEVVGDAAKNATLDHIVSLIADFDFDGARTAMKRYSTNIASP